MENLLALSEQLAEKLLERRRSAPKEMLEECDAALTKLYDTLLTLLRVQEGFTGSRLTEEDRGFAAVVLSHTVLFFLDRIFAWYERGFDWREAIATAYGEALREEVFVAFDVALNAWIEMMRRAGKEGGG